MIITDILVIFFFALLMGGILSWGLGWRHPAGGNRNGSLLFLILILLLAMGAGNAWLEPWGPIWYGSAWLNLMVIGLLVSLLALAISAPTRKPRTPIEAEKEAEEKAVTAAIFGLFFWLLMLGLLVAVIVGIVTRR